MLFNTRGRILALTRLLDAGALVATSGEDAWLMGDAGEGNGIVHVRLTNR